MSDFDKEAEREKLRKQFEADKKKRKSTERMSELLLQGATMTDTHCDSCGSPLFRYQDDEFCPRCQTQQADSNEQAAVERDHEEQEQRQDRHQAADTTESDATSIEIGDESSTPASNSSVEPAVPSPSQSPSPQPRDASGTKAAPSQSPTDLTEARQSLIRTITRTAKQAEAENDLSRVRAFLAATEDAANALEALKRAET